MSKLYVTLFRNDGLLEAAYARPFFLFDDWSIEEARSKCHERLHGVKNSKARLFTDLGVELDDVAFIPSKQSIVVSSGENFVYLSVKDRVNAAVALSSVSNNASPASSSSSSSSSFAFNNHHHLQGSTPATPMHFVMGDSTASATYNDPYAYRANGSILSEDNAEMIDAILQEVYAHANDPLNDDEESVPMTEALQRIAQNFANFSSETAAVAQRIFHAGDTVDVQPITTTHVHQVFPHTSSSLSASAGNSGGSGFDFNSPAGSVASSSSSSLGPLGGGGGGSGGNWSAEDAQLQNIFDNIEFPTVDFNVESLTANNASEKQRAQATSAMYAASQGDQGDQGDQSNASPFSFNEEPMAPSPMYQNVPTFTPPPVITSPPIVSAAAVNGGGGFSKGAGKDTESELQPWQNPLTHDKSEKSMDGLPRHRINEIKSRERLKRSIAELVITVPTLAGMKNASKATIIKKATEFVNYAKKANQILLQENQQARSAIQQLQQEKLRIQHTVQVSNIMTVEITDPEMRYIFVDHMWEIVLGYTKQEVIGRFLKEVVGCPSCPLMQKKAADIRENIEKGAVWTGYILGKRKDGRPFACEATINPVTDSKGDIIQYICTRRNFHLLTVKECKKVAEDVANNPGHDIRNNLVDNEMLTSASLAAMHVSGVTGLQYEEASLNSECAITQG